MRIVMMGVQGSGKGTQSKLLAKELNCPHISTGDLFRANIVQGTDLGKKARQYTDRGELVPDEIVIDIVADRIRQDDANDGYILDGFPRSAVQLAALEYISPIDRAIMLELDDQTAIERLGGRSECTKCGILYGANRKPKENRASRFTHICNITEGVRKTKYDHLSILYGCVRFLVDSIELDIPFVPLNPLGDPVVKRDLAV